MGFPERPSQRPPSSQQPAHPQQHYHSDPNMLTFRSRKWRISFAACLSILALLLLWRPFGENEVIVDVYPPAVRPTEGSYKVPLEAHIISKCPDTRDALQYLIVPAMQQVSEKVAFKLSYIGTPTNHDDGVSCKHGQTECLGNIIELCAAQLYPDPKLHLGFTMCLTRQYDKIPQRELVHDCALEHGIDFDRLNRCVSDDDGAKGISLLRESVEHSAEVNATISCTLRLDGHVRCIRDGGEWKDCERGSSVESLVKDINELYEKGNKVQ